MDVSTDQERIENGVKNGIVKEVWRVERGRISDKDQWTLSTAQSGKERKENHAGRDELRLQ